VQGNILAGEEVVESMARAFLDSAGSLAERLLVSLEAGQAAGGDKRGQQSAALLVEQLGYRDLGTEGIDRLVDLRVDDHAEPIKELHRLLGLWQIEEVNEQALIQYNKGDYPAAVRVLTLANDRFPGGPRILYNLACFESLTGESAKSLAHLREAIGLEVSWREIARNDHDFDSIRAMSEFIALMAG
jgi:uncharacterized Ntn-hydrolase superfamily protein